MRRRALIGWSMLALAAVTVTLGVGWWQVDGPGARWESGSRPMALGQMDFSLIDHEGNAVGPSALAGRPAMIFFGFTRCPDVCPTTLADISGWLDELGTEAGGMNVIFVTVDPARDTAETMAEYVGYFHPAIRGWTGTDAEIARAARGFRVTFDRVPVADGDYSMNHTASVFLYDATGRFVTTIDLHEPREIALPKIRRALATEKQETG